MELTKKLPLFCITGASCAGKSTLCNELFQHETDYIVLESDILWHEFYNTPQDNYHLYRTIWLNMCANISQIGLPCVLCGCCTPQQLEYLRERSLFTEIHYLAVVCDEETMRQRIAKRKVTDPQWVSSSLEFNRWLTENAGKTNPPIRLLDTSALTPQEAAAQVDRWIRSKLVKPF